MAGEISFDLGDERWQIVLRGVPNYVQINVGVIVNEDVTHSRDEAPCDVWKLMTYLR